MKNISIVVTSLCLCGIAFAAPLTKEQADPFRDARQYDLSGLIGFSTGDLAGSKVKDLVSKETTTRVIVLANNTQAPNSVWFVHLGRLIDENPTLEGVWTKDDKTGEKKMSTVYDKLTPAFAVLLESKTGDLTGIIFAAEIIKVVTKKGVGFTKGLLTTGRIVPPMDANWEHKTLSAIRTYISRPGKENLAKDTEPFLTNPLVSVHSASQGWPEVPSVESIKRWADTPESLASLVWEECTIGTLQCGVGGGHMISVVFDTKTGQPKAVAVIPGR